jgi:hypothetical protein
MRFAAGLRFVLAIPLVFWSIASCVTSPARTSATSSQRAPALQYRWFYLQTNLQVTENVPKVESLLRRAAKAGYNGFVLADYKLNILDRVPEWYFKNAERVRQLAAELKLEIIPSIFAVGYSDGILAYDPNLVEGMPVKDAQFVVRSGKADLVPDPDAAIKNGGFEESTADRAMAWDMQDEPGKASFIDRSVKRSGESSLRFGTPGSQASAPANWRINQKITLKPWRYYRLSFWAKTQDLDSPGSFNVPLLIPGSSKPSLTHLNYGVKRTQDWTLHQALFNSQDNTQALAYLGIWGAKSGALWLDDVKLEELGLVNLIRRSGCPLTVKGVDGTVYEEGRDFQPVRDEKMGNVPWAGSFELYHAPPSIVLTPNSRIKEGQSLRVSFYHPVFIYDMQTSCCLTDPKVFDVMRDQMQRIEKLLKPSAILMGHDEVRNANWCTLCQAQRKTPGQLLAENVRRCRQIVKETSPQARVYAWNDMFDPYHNAKGDYYLVNGSWEGSWEGLTPDVGIVNWYFEPRKQNLPWFSKRGHKQILAGYYDNNVEYTKTWLEDAKEVSGIVGVMYTTWQSRYDDLEKFARVVWGGG